MIFVSFSFLSDLHAQNWELVWSDEFEGNELNEAKWSYQYGTGASEGLSGWGNNELQYYTDREENIYVSDGNLHIIAREESYEGMNFTSARIRSINQGDWTYGRFEIRAKLPEGQGIWPAIWMMPTDAVYGGWAASGEIDIMELVGHEPDVVHGTLHYGGSWPNNVHTGSSYSLDAGKFSDDFHTFALEWEEGEMRWYVDGEHYQTQNDWYTEGHDFPAPFDERFHFILNVAVGGNWPGNPDHTTEFPQEMVIDYIRVYQDSNQGLGVILPLDFEDTDFPWDDVFTDFDGGSVDVVENPDPSELNDSDWVGRMVKGGGEFWGGSWFPVANSFVFDEENHTIEMKVWSPRENVPVLMKVEQQEGDQEYELNMTTTTSGEWEKLSWDMSGAGFSIEWDLITLIFDMQEGQEGDGSTDFTWYFDDLEVEAAGMPTTIPGDERNQPYSYSLKQNYPNPFNPVTQIQFELPEQSEVILEVFDIMGRQIVTLVNGNHQPGQHTVEFDATDFASGIYLYRLQTGSFTQTQKMTLLK